MAGIAIKRRKRTASALRRAQACLNFHVFEAACLCAFDQPAVAAVEEGFDVTSDPRLTSARIKVASFGRHRSSDSRDKSRTRSTRSRT